MSTAALMYCISSILMLKLVKVELLCTVLYSVMQVIMIIRSIVYKLLICKITAIKYTVNKKCNNCNVMETKYVVAVIASNVKYLKTTTVH